MFGTQQPHTEDLFAAYRIRTEDMLRWAEVGRWDIDSATGTFNCDSEFIEKYGYEAATLLPLTVEKYSSLIHPDDVSYAMQNILQLLSGQVETVDLKYRVRTAHGDYRHFRVRGGVYGYTEDMQPVRVSGVLQDITEQVRSAEIFERRDKLLFAVSEAAAILLGVSQKSLGEKINQVLALLGKVTGVDRVFFWQNYIKEDGKHYASQVCEWSLDAAAQQGNRATNFCLEKNVPVWFEQLASGDCVSSVISATPSPEHLFLEERGIASILIAPVVFQDFFWGFIGFDYYSKEYEWDKMEGGILQTAGTLIVSALVRKQAEDELEREKLALDTIINTCPIAMVTTKDGVIQRANKSYQDTFNASVGDSICGYYPNQLDRQDVLDSIAKNNKFYRAGVPFLCTDNEIREFLVSALPIEEISINTIIAWLVDVSQLKKTERELIKSRDSAEIATKVKSEFLARMSHEIRTPMNAILGMIYLCLQTGLNDKQKDYLTKTQTAANSLLGIINDILDFSKIEADKLKLESIPFVLRDVIADVVDMTSVSVMERNLKQTVSIDPELEPVLIGDPLRLRQILLNLVSNAVKFTEKGKIGLTVEADDTLSGKKNDKIRLRFTVSDTGIGLTEEQIGRIFDSFSQADGSTTRKYGGTGLGLAIVKNLVGLMGGIISVQSQPGQGTSFSFTVVFDKSPEHPEDASAVLLNRQRVLIVDDDPNACSIVAELLQSWKMIADTANSGQQALDKLTSAARMREPYDLILLDWRMPRMDGIETIRQIHKNEVIFPPPHILMISAYDRLECLQQTQGMNVAGILLKPAEPLALKKAIKHAFAQKRDAKIEETKTDLNGVKVLLADDNKINQMVAMELLRMYGVEVTVVNDGIEAVQQVRDNDFDLVLMDVQMPVMDGLEATEEIRKLKKTGIDKLPILAMTANAMDSDYHKSLAVGMNDHLTKPIDPGKLKIALEKWIKR